MLKKVEVGFMIGLLAYVVFRFVLVAGSLKTYGVNPWVFLLLDVVTVPPYVKGNSGLIRSVAKDDSLAASLGWGTVVIASFAAPYVYMYAVGGQNFPLIVSIVIGFVIFMLALHAVVKILKEVRGHEAKI